jgi:ABC-type multidrug transport system fused ATPase/permease subunit
VRDAVLPGGGLALAFAVPCGKIRVRSMGTRTNKLDTTMRYGLLGIFRFSKAPAPTEAGQASRTTAPTWNQLRSLLTGRRRAVAILAVSSTLAGLTEAGVLAVLAQTAVALVDRTGRVSVTLGFVHLEETLGWVIALGFALALARLALQIVLSTVPSRIASDMQANVRTTLFAAYTRASWSEQARDREGHFQELVTNQATAAGQSVGQAAAVVVAGLTFFVLICSSFALNFVAALAVLAIAVTLFAILRPLSRLSNGYARALSDASLRFAGRVNEAVRLAEETQVFGTDGAQRELSDELIAVVRITWFRAGRLLLLVPGLYQSLIYLLVLAALAGLYTAGTVPAASLSAVVLLLVRAGAYGQQVQTSFQNLGQSLPYLERVQEAERRYAASRRAAGERTLETVSLLAFDGVSFAYEPGQPVLSKIDFEVRAGEAIGIVGPSGVGKSTLVQILLGLRDPQSGRYVVNGVSARDFRREDWHRLFAYLPQEPRLLHASVADNIRFFRDLDDIEVQYAARLAGIHDEVMKWTDGYDTLIGPRADAISGGQQQRICLARALAAKPEVLILDEPTSALDRRAELRIQESLGHLKHELTLFVVAHRMSTLDVCDRVMVIVDGRMEAFARLADLRAMSPYYRSASAARPSVSSSLGTG